MQAFSSMYYFCLRSKDSGGKIVFGFTRKYRIGSRLWVSVNVCVYVCMHGKGQIFKIISYRTIYNFLKLLSKMNWFSPFNLEKRSLFLYSIAFNMLDVWPSAISKSLGFSPGLEKIHRLPSNPYADQYINLQWLPGVKSMWCWTPCKKTIKKEETWERKAKKCNM